MCLKGYASAGAALKRIKNRPHSCVYQCQKCNQWHTNHTGRPVRHELYRDHIVQHSPFHAVAKPQEHHCETCTR